MRLKLIILAVGAALAAYALIWGSDTVSKISKYRSTTTISQSEEAADAGGGDEIPNVMQGGVGGVNKNLSGLKNNLQNTMDERPGRLDDRVDQAKK